VYSYEVVVADIVSQGILRYIRFHGDYREHMLVNFLTELTDNYHYAEHKAFASSLLTNHTNFGLIIHEMRMVDLN
jgi:hypothetical protein